MRIHSLTLDNVRGIEHLELADLPETGVIVIHGENEAGKSTILDALDAVLNQRHGAKNSAVKQLQPVHRDVPPEVFLHATIGPYTFKLRKQWLSRAATELELVAPQRANFKGREADDKLADIIAEHMDAELAQTLFMRQNAVPSGIKAVGIPSMTHALDREVGEDSTGTEDTELLQRIESEYQRYFTPKGKPVKEITQRIEKIAEFTALLEDKRREKDRLGERVDEVDRKHREIEGIRSELPDAVREVEELQKQFVTAQKTKDAADQAAERAYHAEAALKRILADKQHRELLVERLELAKANRTALAAQVSELSAKTKAESDKIAELELHRDTAVEQEKKARKALREAQNLRDNTRASSKLTALRALIDDWHKADEEVARLRSELPERTISDDDVSAVEDASNELLIQKRLREASAAKLIISRPTSGEVLVDDTPVELSGETFIELHDGTRLELDNFAATFQAAATSSDSVSAVENAEHALSELLDELGCAELAEVRLKRDQHREVTAQLSSAVDSRKSILGTREIDDIKAEIENLEEQLDSFRESADALTEEEAERRVQENQEAFDQASILARSAEAQLGGWAARKAHTELEIVRARLQAAEEAVKTATSELDTQLEKLSDEDFALKLHEATTTHETTRKALELAREELEAARPDLAESLLNGATARVENLKKRESDAHIRIVELTSHIETAQGIAEEVDQLEAKVAQLSTEADRVQRRADAVNLLRSTMHSYRDAARKRYAEPFARALNRYASIVFGPEVSFELDDDLQVVERSLAGATVPLEQLSGGAKEQLAVLTRFAIAELASGGTEAGSVPVVVDDALGSTDPQRLKLMNTLFNTVGMNNQVLVLTCYPQRFDRVNTAARHSIDDLKSTGENPH
ncbi:AAA family ATPase [Corynebacterium breve]|uniref:AAA family ATPase n=1 Tax=Corynebacterium breve TaxID=3049799 RepID=A0ABY8VG33_9CORY|nr:AAA family ATPase [Corynebacterium breve]WIM68604.1 AAA family ATPase [Corynebacterium breve]